MLFRERVLQPTDPSKALLNASPYLLIAGWLLLMLLVIGIPDNGVSTSWQLARWGLRLVNLAVALWAWLDTSDEEPRPHWALGWLGFALYEITGIGLLGVAFVSNQGWLYGTASLLYLPLLFCAFVPWMIGSTWIAYKNQAAARFTVFSHAALTAPLFLAAVEWWPSASGSILYWELFVLLLLAGGIAALYEMVVPQRRTLLIYASILLCQSLTPLLGLFREIGGLAILAAILLSAVGSVIVTVPFVLSMLWSMIDNFLGDHGARLRKRIASNLPGRSDLSQELSTVQSHFVAKGEKSMSDTSAVTPDSPQNPPPLPPRLKATPGFDRLFRFSVIILALFAIGTLVTLVGRSALYKIHEYERGLHLRGGRFLAVQQPGWHLQIPLVDTVIIVKTNERLGYVERISTMTSDNVTMIVSLQYTYKVTDPQQFALQVDDPERIVFEFVQGKLRDVVNSKAMNDVMNNRVVMNDQVISELKEKEAQYGVQFVTVQLQSASPPDEVLTAIKDRMVAVQRQEQAQAEAAQKKTQSDAEFYAAQKQAEAEAYQITKTAEAQAESVRLMTEAQQLSIRSIIGELDGKGALGEKYIEYLIAQQIKDNSKWVISGQSTPILDLRESTASNTGGE